MKKVVFLIIGLMIFQTQSKIKADESVEEYEKKQDKKIEVAEDECPDGGSWC